MKTLFGENSSTEFNGVRVSTSHWANPIGQKLTRIMRTSLDDGHDHEAISKNSEVSPKLDCVVLDSLVPWRPWKHLSKRSTMVTHVNPIPCCQFTNINFSIYCSHLFDSPSLMHRPRVPNELPTSYHHGDGGRKHHMPQLIASDFKISQLIFSVWLFSCLKQQNTKKNRQICLYLNKKKTYIHNIKCANDYNRQTQNS